MTSKERGPVWQGDDSFGPGWGNQIVHESRPAAESTAVGEDFGAGARGGALTRGGYGAQTGEGFAVRDAGWHADVEKVRPHMEVRGSDGGHVGLVDKLRGDHIVLTRSDANAGGVHHAIPAGWVANVDDKVHLNTTAEDARTRWRTEGRNRALFEREDSGSDGPHILGRAFSGTYPEDDKK